MIFCIENPSYKKKCIKILNRALCVEKITTHQKRCKAKALKAYDEDMTKFMEDTQRCGSTENLHKCEDNNQNNNQDNNQDNNQNNNQDNNQDNSLNNNSQSDNYEGTTYKLSKDKKLNYY